jgi:hypothetical protein
MLLFLILFLLIFILATATAAGRHGIERWAVMVPAGFTAAHKQRREDRSHNAKANPNTDDP